jgi:L-malate glycosyltransferase
MHIVHIFSHKGICGVPVSGSALVNALARSGHKITLIHRPGAWIADQKFEGDITLQPFDMGVRILNYSGIRELYRQFKADGVDVIHTHGSAADRVGGLCYMFGKIPTVAKAAARIVHMHWRFHDAIIAPSQYTVDFYTRTRLASPKRLHPVPNFLSSNGFPETTPQRRHEKREELGLPQDAFVFVSVGGIQHRKNQSATIPILKGLVERGVNAYCTLIGGKGGDEAKKVASAAKAAGLSDRVLMTGQRSDARELLTAFDALVSTSRDEQASVVLLEGLAAGLPLYFTAVGSASEIIKDGENGLIIDADAPASAIQAMYELANSPQEQQRLSQNNRRLFEAEFTPEVVIPKFEAVYRHISG